MDFIPKGITLLPNTSGARNAEEAVRIARLRRGNCRIRHHCRSSQLHNFACLRGTPDPGVNNDREINLIYQYFDKFPGSQPLIGTGRVRERGGEASSPLTGFLRD